MGFQKSFLLSFLILFFIQQYQSIPEEYITTIKIPKLENNIIKDQSSIFTKDKYLNFKFFKIDFSSLDDATEENNFSFIKISIKLKNEYSYKSFTLYVNKTLNDFNSSTNSYTDYSVQDKNPTIFLPKKYFCKNEFIYFFIQGDRKLEFEYIIETFTDDIILQEKENKFNVLIKPGRIEFFFKLKQGLPKGFLLMSLLTSGVIEDGKEIYMRALCPNKDDLSMGKYYPYFINGVGLLIEDKELISCKNPDEDYFYFKIILQNNLKKTINLEFNSQYLDVKNDHDFRQKDIYENTIYTSLLLGLGNIYKQCFKFSQQLEDRSIFYSYVLNVRTTSSHLLVSYYYEGDLYYIKNKNISFTGTVDIDSRGPDKYIMICIENFKKYITGVQFQIRPKYEKELINFTKLPLMPMINGFPTYLKIDKVNGMIYKIDVRQFLYGINNIGSSYFLTNKRIVKYHLVKLNQVDIKLGHIRCRKFAMDLNFRTCETIYNTVYNMNMDLFLNYEYDNKNNLYYDEYVYVTCNDENKNCEFLLEVNLSDNDDTYPIQLIQYKNYWQSYYYKSISKRCIDKYKISLSNKLEENSKLVIVLYMFSGDADLSIYDYNNDESNIALRKVIQDTEYYSIGKKKYLIYNIKPFNNKLNYNFREILLKITSSKSGYYSVKYYTWDNNSQNNNMLFSLPVGEINFDKISYGEGTKTYVLSSLLSMSKVSYYHSESDNEYYITINSVNCVLDIDFMEKKYIGREIQVFFLQKNIKKNNLNIKIYELDSHTKEQNEFCIYYIAANSVEFQRNSITINEGVAHSMILDDKIETISYKYPYPYDENIVSISLYKYYKGDLEVRVSINDVYTTHMITMRNIHYKKLVLYVNVLKKYCSTANLDKYKDFVNLCPININIRLAGNKDQKEERINRVQIEVSPNGKTPIYIRDGEVRFDSVIAGQYSISGKQKIKYVYYYSDIGIDEYPCEIILNNKFGACEAVAKIVPKNNVDMLPNWDRRVRLPTIDDNDKTDYLKYDYELNKITILKKDVEKCKQGCEVYIGVFTRETSVYFQINDFFIMFNKNNKNYPTSLLFNQNIDDSITKYIDTKYYISYLENESIDELLFTFNSDFCSLCIMMVDEEKDFDIKKMNKCDWKLDNILNGYKNYMLSIKDNDNKLQGKNLTSIKFISKISSHIMHNKDNLFYSLKINKQNTEFPKIINVDSYNNEIAQLDSQTGIAYYAIRVHEYQIINEINLLVISDEKIINDNLVLYAKIIRQEDFNEDGFNDTLFNENYSMYDISSNNNIDSDPKNYLKVSIPNDKEEDKIVLLLVKCNSMNKVDILINHYVKIMVAFYKSNANTSLKINNIKFYNLHLEAPRFFIPLLQDKYSIVIINCLKGKGKIVISEQNNAKINKIISDQNSAKKNEIMIDSTISTEYKIVLDLTNDNNFNSETKFVSLRVDNAHKDVNKNSLMFYIYYYNKNIKNNIEYLDANKNNIIFYPFLNNIQKHKSLSYYLNINNLDLINNSQNDILIEMSFNNEYIKESINGNYNSNALGALINDEFLYENVINEQQIIFSPIYSKVFHNPNNNKIYFLFKKNETNIYRQNFGYYLISIGNDYFDYNTKNLNDNNKENKNDMFLQIKVLEYKESEIGDCFEIANKYKPLQSSKNKNDIISENKKEEKRFLSYKTIIILMIIIAVIIIYLTFRCIRKKNIVSVTDYFNRNDSLILK